ncbi:MAG: hypothetical protein QM754_05270 [Tepidisphaeraceae bacterium]
MQTAERCTLTDQHLQYQGNVTAVRPTTAMLLSTLWSDVTRSHTIHEVTAALYGKPSTLRSVRQIVFRANRNFEELDCPLIIHCRSLYVFVQYRPPRFLTALPDACRATHDLLRRRLNNQGGTRLPAFRLFAF